MRLAFAALAATAMLAPAIARDVGQWGGLAGARARVAQPAGQHGYLRLAAAEADVRRHRRQRARGRAVHRPHRNAGERIVVPSRKVCLCMGSFVIFVPYSSPC